MSETESSGLYDISDFANESDIYEVEKESEFRIKDINITTQIKLLFLFFVIIEIGLSVMYVNFTGIIIWSIVGIFIADLLGFLDGAENFLKSGRKPRGGYENV